MRTHLGQKEMAVVLTDFMEFTEYGRACAERGKTQITRFDVHNWSRRDDFPDPVGVTTNRMGAVGNTYDILEVLTWFFEWEPKNGKAGRGRGGKTAVPRVPSTGGDEIRKGSDQA